MGPDRFIPEYNDKKLKELTLYISHQSKGDPRFDETKLYLLIYQIDFGAYRMLKAPITGATYQHYPGGPAPRELAPVKRSLISGGDAVREYRGHPIWSGNRLAPNRGADMSDFSEAEMDLVESVLDAFRGWESRQMSERAMKETGWQLTENYEDIPYESALISTVAITPEVVEQGWKIASAAGLLEKHGPPAPN